MKRCIRLGTWIIFFVTISALHAMPPSPQLIERIQNNLISPPYYLDHLNEIRQKGVNSPTRNEAALNHLQGRSLDEDFNAIAILIQFSDHLSVTGPEFFDNLLYGPSVGTVQNYYNEISYTNLTIVTVDMPGDLGWYTAPHTYAYYVNSENGFGNYPQNAQKLTEDAIAAANPFVDFSNYDNDNDGYVDALFIIHSGSGAEFTGNSNDIWSHKWETNTPQFVDGVIAEIYAMQPEYWLTAGDMTCGVFCHELGHATFGLPDLYDYDYDSNGLGRWSLMSGGTWNGSLGNSPAHPDAWCKIQMGLVEPTMVAANLYNAVIPRVEDNPVIYKLHTNVLSNSEYFLVENRQQTGYDASLPGNGLLIYHVDETQYGNNDQWYPGYTNNGNYLVALEQADGLWQLEHNFSSGNSGDPYPGAANNRSFGYGSTPNSDSYAFNPTYIGVENISNSGTNMTADLLVSLEAPLTTIYGFGDDIYLFWTNTSADSYRVYSALTSSGPFNTLVTETADTSFVDIGAVASESAKFYAVHSILTRP